MSAEEQGATPVDLAALADRLAALEVRIAGYADVLGGLLIEHRSIVEFLNEFDDSMVKIERAVHSLLAGQRRRAQQAADPLAPDRNHEDYQPGTGHGT